MSETDNKDKKAQDHPMNDIDQAAIKEQAGEVFKKLPLLGPISWLYGQSKSHQHYFLNDMNWLVMPALVTDQYKLYLRDDAPISYISWASVSAEVIARIENSHQMRLAPQEWKSGDQILIIDVVSPFGNAQQMIKNLRDSEFSDQKVHIYVPALPGKSSGKVVPLPEAESPDTEQSNTEGKSVH